MKTALTIEQQLDLLESRGLIICDREKAKEILRDIGFYRLGFYLFPFEKSYPDIKNRIHVYFDGALFEDAVRLYYFDFDLRLLLMRYLNRIEIAFRTALINGLSNKYKGNSRWFVDDMVVSREYISEFDRKIYTSDYRRNPIIHRHHQKYPADRYAPAWKTLEFMTFGAVLKLYEQLQNKEDKIQISQYFGVRQTVTFESYMHTIRQVRNACAHGQVLYDFKLPVAIRRGPASWISFNRNNIIGSLSVVKYVMSQVSKNRSDEMCSEIKKLYAQLCRLSPSLRLRIYDFSVLSIVR